MRDYGMMIVLCLVDVNMTKYTIVQIGNTNLYVVIDTSTGLRLTLFGIPMRPISKSDAEMLLKFANKTVVGW